MNILSKFFGKIKNNHQCSCPKEQNYIFKVLYTSEGCYITTREASSVDVQTSNGAEVEAFYLTSEDSLFIAADYNNNEDVDISFYDGTNTEKVSLKIAPMKVSNSVG